MPSSLTKLYAHLIFSTKDRRRFLDDSIRPKVHGCLAEIIRAMNSPYVVVGGVDDHVHMLFDMGKLHAPASIVKELKVESSKFAKTLGRKYRQFYWQRGYGIFSVGPLNRDQVEQYVRNQEQHHRTKSYMDEFRSFLHTYNIEYDERYLWT